MKPATGPQGPVAFSSTTIQHGFQMLPSKDNIVYEACLSVIYGVAGAGWSRREVRKEGNGSSQVYDHECPSVS